MEHAFDTLAFAESLEQGGFTRQQAQVLAREQAKLIDERLATKRDIGDVRADIETLRISGKNDLTALELKLDKRLAEFELRLKDLQIRIGGMIVALGGVLIAIKYFG